MNATSAFDGFDRAEGSHHRQVRAPRSIAGRLAEEPGFWAWRLEAACGGLPSSVFFSPDGERGAARRRRERAAKLVCAGCRVRERCADYALSHRERYGVWGGLSEHERAMIWDRQRGTAT
jgi:WhiB family redox-sensing transcriptional regulator